MEFIEVSAKTVNDAITEASIQLGVVSTSMEYKVIEEGSAGFLGIGRKQAVIRAWKKVVKKEEKPVKPAKVEKEIKTMERKIDEGVRSVDIRPELQKTQLSINKELNSIKKDVSFKDFKSNLGGK